MDMAYPLSATKLKSYHACPQFYYFKYERKLEDKGMFAQPELGKALHKALEYFYRDWHYNEPIPKRELRSLYSGTRLDVKALGA